MNLNLCKSRGGISARTKSLREKFSSKRSYSELTFKDSTTSLTETTDLSSPGSSFKSRNKPQVTFNLITNNQVNTIKEKKIFFYFSFSFSFNFSFSLNLYNMKSSSHCLLLLHQLRNSMLMMRMMKIMITVMK